MDDKKYLNEISDDAVYPIDSADDGIEIQLEEQEQSIREDEEAIISQLEDQDMAYDLSNDPNVSETVDDDLCMSVETDFDLNSSENEVEDLCPSETVEDSSYYNKPVNPLDLFKLKDK